MTARLDLPVRLDTEAAETLKQQLLAHQGQDVELGGSGVEHLGALCLQVLISASKTWGAANRKLSWDGVSEALKEQLGLYGFSPETVLGAAT